MTSEMQLFHRLGDVFAWTGGHPPSVALRDEQFDAMRRAQLIDDHNTVAGVAVIADADDNLFFNRWAVVVRHINP